MLPGLQRGGRVRWSGPYAAVATVEAEAADTFYVDAGLTPGTTYYYVVSADTPRGESADSAEASAAATTQLFGTVIGTEGSYDGAGATRDTVFDGSLRNFFDGPESISRAGLDLGAAVVIAEVRYCPRTAFSGRMVGGQFQGANAADFSDAVKLFAIGDQPAFTSQSIGNTLAFRYVRYVGPEGGYGNVAEIQFFERDSALLSR